MSPEAATAQPTCVVCLKQFPMDELESIGEVGDGQVVCKQCLVDTVECLKCKKRFAVEYDDEIVVDDECFQIYHCPHCNQKHADMYTLSESHVLY